jgi:hypothetical protein
VISAWRLLSSVQAHTLGLIRIRLNRVMADRAGVIQNTRGAMMFEISVSFLVWAMGLVTGLGLGTAIASQRFDKERTEWITCD